MFNYYIFFYVLGLMNFCFNQFNLLMCLISLEFVYLCSYILLIFNMFIYFDHGVYIIYLLVGILESVLGLVVFFNVICVYGNDYLLCSSILQC